MSEIEDYKRLYALLKEENELRKQVIAGMQTQIDHSNNIIGIQNRIIELQEKMIHDMITRKSVPHLRLV